MASKLRGRVLGLLLLGALPLLTQSCDAGPDYVEPHPEVGGTFSWEDPRFDVKAEPASTWWLTFKDATLSDLVQDAIHANYDLQIAAANLRVARDLLLEERFNQLPIATFEGGYERQRASKYNTPFPIRDRNFWFAGLDATWELDVFGGVRRAVEARGADLDAAEATVRDATTSVIAEVARTYAELRGAQASYAIAQGNAKNQKDTYDLTVRLLDGGRGTELDTSRAKSQLAATLATVPVYRTSIHQAIYRLSVLTGRRPGELTASLVSPGRQPPLPDLVPVGDPKGLLRRRPDVRVAERRLAAATARIGVQTADLYPHLVLVGSLGVQADKPSNVVHGADYFSIGPHLSWAAFDLGRVNARIRAAGDAAQAEGANFFRSVLYALEEIADALVAYSDERERMDQLAESVRTAEIASTLARQRYEGGGIGDFLSVLDSERRTFEAQQALSDSRTRATISLIAVYKALGAGSDLSLNLLPGARE